MSLNDIFIPEDELPDISELPEDLQIMVMEIERGLVGEVGANRARLLAVMMVIRIGQAFAGTLIRTGGIKALLRNHRDKMIRKACDEGETNLALARKWELDTRTITKINGRVDKPAGRQMELWSCGD